MMIMMIIILMVMFTLEQATKAQRDGGGIAVIFL